MARIKHIALSSEDPAKTAAFYQSVFGLSELHRKPADTGDEGVWLTDGYIYFAILKHGSHEAPNMGEGASTVPGIILAFMSMILRKPVKPSRRPRPQNAPRAAGRIASTRGPRA